MKCLLILITGWCYYVDNAVAQFDHRRPDELNRRFEGPDFDPPHDHSFHHHHHHDQGPFDGGFFPDPHQSSGRRTFNYLNKEEQATNNSSIPLDFAFTINEHFGNNLIMDIIEDAPQDVLQEEQPAILQSRFAAVLNATERNAVQQARLAKCMPELRTVKIVESTDPNVFYIPECIRIERCGGCCHHDLLECQPIDKTTVSYSVIKTEYTGNNKLKFQGKEPVVVEKHTKCKCGCKVKAEDCSPYQEYKESQCRCVCKNVDEEKKCYKNSYKKLWNPDQCACVCREVEECTTGFQFDHNECRCIQSQFQRRYILNNPPKEQPDSVAP